MVPANRHSVESDHNVTGGSITIKMSEGILVVVGKPSPIAKFDGDDTSGTVGMHVLGKSINGGIAIAVVISGETAPM